MAPGMKQKPTRAPIANEAGNGLKNERYTVAMARTSDPHSATAQFFINVADNAFLDHKSPERRRAGATACSARSSRARTSSTRSRACRPASSGGHENVPTEDVVIERAKSSRADASTSAWRQRRCADAVHLRPAPVAGAAGAGRRRSTRSARARRATPPALYVLGDLFDSWIGDDQLREPLAARRRRRAARRRATPAFRVVSCSAATATSCSASASPRPPARRCCPSRSSSTSHGTPTLLMHGDELCTDDVDYQRFRAWMRDPAHQRALPGAALARAPRHRRAGCAARAARATAGKPEAIMDVERRRRRRGVPRRTASRA